MVGSDIPFWEGKAFAGVGLARLGAGVRPSVRRNRATMFESWPSRAQIDQNVETVFGGDTTS